MSLEALYRSRCNWKRSAWPSNQTYVSTSTREMSPGVQLPHPCPVQHSQFTDGWHLSDSCMQYGGHQIRLLQCPSVRHTWGDTWQTSACSE